MKPFESYIADMFVPRIGHVEASSYPDYPYLKWRYTDSSGSRITRDNLKSSIDAVNYIYRKFKAAKTPTSPCEDLAQDHPDDYKKIRALLQQTGDLDNRIQRWKNYTNAVEYNRTTWRKAALIGNLEWDDMSISERKIHTRHIKGKAHFDVSKWAYFHRAALKQRSLVLGWIN